MNGWVLKYMLVNVKSKAYKYSHHIQTWKETTHEWAIPEIKRPSPPQEDKRIIS